MDLSTAYLGFSLPHPIMPGASPLSDNLDTVKRLEDAGAAAIVMYSLFEEQIIADQERIVRDVEVPENSYAEALTYHPLTDEIRLGPDRYLEKVAAVKKSVSVPVIGSLNGVSEGGWTRHARLIEQAGANALELNIYFLAENQSDIDTENLEILSKLKLSTRDELLLRLRWLAMISGSLRLSLGITGGVHTGIDVVKAIMCGAHGVQMVSALLLNQPEYLTIVKNELSEWLESHEYESLGQMRGSMGKEHAPDRDLLERVNYIRVLQGGVG